MIYRIALILQVMRDVTYMLPWYKSGQWMITLSRRMNREVRLLCCGKSRRITNLSKIIPRYHFLLLDKPLNTRYYCSLLSLLPRIFFLEKKKRRCNKKQGSSCTTAGYRRRNFVRSICRWIEQETVIKAPALFCISETNCIEENTYIYTER